MAIVKPFRALRPAQQYAEETAALPYDVYSRAEAYRKVQGHPLSFLNIDRPETQFPEDADMYAPEVYEKAAEMLKEQTEQGIYVEEESPCYYLYELTMNGRTQTGIAACVAVDDYLNGVVLKHEFTLEAKEQDRIRHITALQAQTGPIFLAYRKDDLISEIMAETKQNEPLYDITADDGIRHRIWIIPESGKIAALQQEFAEIPNLYIADGHHRTASAVKTGLKMRELHPDYDGTEEFNYFLAVLFPDEELKILDYNRVVKDLNGMSAEEFLKKLEENFTVEESAVQVQPQKKGQFGLYLDEKWYVMNVREEKVPQDVIGSLDVSLLQDLVLTPLLGIMDVRTDSRIGFVGGIRGIGELERRCHEDMRLAFSMYPTSMEELFAVADEGRMMPPKSTWFEPKLRSGLLIHRF